ncbi:hypothetical protein AB7M35_000732 [Amorphus suaedae]
MSPMNSSAPTRTGRPDGARRTVRGGRLRLFAKVRALGLVLIAATSVLGTGATGAPAADYAV